MLRFEGKVAIVTGAGLADLGLGIGGATALALAREGARVVIGNRTVSTAAALADEIRTHGGDVVWCPLDQGSEESIAAMVELAEKTYGGVDILINNATGMAPEDLDVLTTPVEVWDRIFDINPRGVFLFTKYVLPFMLKAGGGAIVNVSSGSAMLGDVTRIAYGSSKGAINTLTQYVATQYGKLGIRCNAVCPGLTVTAKAKAELPTPVTDIFLKHTLTPRLGTPEQLADVVTFLASDAAAFVNGIVMPADGGLWQHHAYTADMEELMKSFAPEGTR